MQSFGSMTFLPAGNITISNDTTDVLDVKAIAEFERDRKRAHKGHHDHKKRVAGIKGHHHNISNNHHDNYNRLPAWKRGGAGDLRERRAFSNLTWDARDEDQWVEEWIRGDEEDFDFDKENKPSRSALMVGLEDLIIRSPILKGGKKLLLSRPVTPRQISRAGTPLGSTFPEDILFEPLVDTHGQSDSDSDGGSDDGFGYCEFSSPGADDWSVVVAEDGCLEYSTSSGGSLASVSSTTTVIVMPCTW